MRPILECMSPRAHVEVIVVCDIPPSIMQAYAAEPFVATDTIAHHTDKSPRASNTLRDMHDLVRDRFARLRPPFVFLVNISARSCDVFMKALK